jgi:hypothetical protein
LEKAIPSTHAIMIGKRMAQNRIAGSLKKDLK